MVLRQDPYLGLFRTHVRFSQSVNLIPEERSEDLYQRLMAFFLYSSGSFPVTVINTKDSEFLKIAGDCLLAVSLQHLSLYKLDLHMRAGTIPIAKWDLDDIPRFRLQKLNQLNDAEKIFIINLAR